MGKYTYPTIAPVASTRGGGKSDSTTLQSMYPASPYLVSVGLTTSDAAKYKTEVLALLLNGVVEGNQQIGSYNRDYSGNGAPNYADVKTGAGGLPASPWVPNPVSPGEGSVNPSDMGAPPEGFGLNPTNGSHAGSSTAVTAGNRNPSASSSNMSTINLPADLGKSPATKNAS